MRNRILLVEADAERRDRMEQTLEEASYFVISTAGPEKALERIWKGSPDLLMFSPSPVGMTGLQMVTFLKGDARLKHIPLVLVSDPLPPQDVVSFFRAGIDEHIHFSTPTEELLARLRALLRRVYPAERTDQSFEYGGLVLSPEERRVTVEGRPVELTRKEFELLKHLMTAPNKVISARTLLSTVWGYEKDVSTKTLQVHIHRLRQKLGAPARHIRNSPGVGYTFSTY